LKYINVAPPHLAAADGSDGSDDLLTMGVHWHLDHGLQIVQVF
jgi:hypothetical protein